MNLLKDSLVLEMPTLLKFPDREFPTLFEAALLKRQKTTMHVDVLVREIVQQVREHGDQALLEYTERYDGTKFRAHELRVSAEEINSSYDSCDTGKLNALEFAATRIESFHERQIPAGFSFKDDSGVMLTARWAAIQSVGLYVPGGQAAYPSSLLMNAIPARLAGVKRMALVVPCPTGVINPYLLAAAKMSGVDEIYRIGGAQAIAALAYGTETVAPVDKIVGPGNAYVAEAKRQVFGAVGIDAIAGPSEILVVADKETNPAWVAIDLLSQAEHDGDAQCTLITDDAGMVEEVETEIAKCLDTLGRSKIARESWQTNGLIILVEDLRDAPCLINRIAPEHIELAISHPERLVNKIRNAGTIFIGRHTPEAIGDYVAGPNHVLPTAGSSRFASGLSVADFCKCTNLVECSDDSLRAIGEAGITLAQLEGLDAHAKSIAIRLSNR